MNRTNYISPPINPGVRTWCGVEPDRHVVDYSYQSRPNLNLDEMMGHRAPVAGCDMGPLGCGYPHPYSPPTGGERIEGFGNLNSDMLLKIIVLIALGYFVYNAMNKNQ